MQETNLPKRFHIRAKPPLSNEGKTDHEQHLLTWWVVLSSIYTVIPIKYPPMFISANTSRNITGHPSKPWEVLCAIGRRVHAPMSQSATPAWVGMRCTVEGTGHWSLTTKNVRLEQKLNGTWSFSVYTNLNHSEQVDHENQICELQKHGQCVTSNVTTFFLENHKL